MVAVLTIKLPTDEEEELLRRFTVNKNYLAGIAGFLTSTYGRRAEMYTGLKATIEAHRPYQTIQRGQVDIEEVRRFLTLGWASEIQLHLPALMSNEAVTGFANTWAPVHAYYSAFGMLQAWFAANGMVGAANDHTSTLRTIAKMIEQRDIFPEPWNLLAIGCPMRGERLHLNHRGVDCTSHVEVLSIPNPLGLDPMFWQRYGTWLRSTRAARLTAREQAWKKKNDKKRISPTERSKIAQSVAPTSLFDCLWRMRIKSNYGTIDPYLVAQISASDHAIFNQALCITTRATVALIELYILRRIGKSDYAQIAADFIRQDSAGLSARMLQARCTAYAIKV